MHNSEKNDSPSQLEGPANGHGIAENALEVRRMTEAFCSIASPELRNKIRFLAEEIAAAQFPRTAAARRAKFEGRKRKDNGAPE
jgi:hypothetical protein